MTALYTPLPAFHDGLLLGILVKDRTAALFVQSDSGVTSTISLQRVHRLRTSDFYEGNTIFDCVVIHDPAVAEEELGDLIRGGSRSTGVSHLRAMMSEGTHKLFVLTPSYGATVIALVGEIDVAPGFVMP